MTRSISKAFFDTLCRIAKDPNPKSGVVDWIPKGIPIRKREMVNPNPRPVTVDLEGRIITGLDEEASFTMDDVLHLREDAARRKARGEPK